jgi:hypothetical protein
MPLDYVMHRCDKDRSYAYERLGLYYVTGGKNVPFLDLYLNFYVSPYWHAPTKQLDAYYTTPGRAIKDLDIEVITRKKLRKQVFEDNAAPLSSLYIENGGEALFVKNKKADVTDCWIFGPLLFQGKEYGSIVAELQNFKWPIVHQRVRPGQKHDYTDSPENVRNRIETTVTFPTMHGTQFETCILWGSNWKLGRWGYKQNGINMTEDEFLMNLKDYRAEAVRVTPAPPVKGVAWRLDAKSANATECELYEEHG